MKNQKFVLLGFVVFLFILTVPRLVLANESNQTEKVMTNLDVIELVKSGLSENIIIAKIKSSKNQFDTSAEALVKLKDSGVPDNLIVVMIEVKSNVEETPVQNTAEMKVAVGKRKVFVKTDDEEAKLETVKKLTGKGFSIVNDENLAELIFEISYTEATTESQTGIFRPGNNTEFITKIGKLVVKLNQDSNQFLIYAREFPFSRMVTTSAIFGVSPAPPSLRDQLRKHLLDDFLKHLKKAGDKE